jgi:phage tail tape-measure protein
MKCPRCGSTHISNREVGMRTSATLGGLVGAATGINSALRGAQAGVTIGASAGPVGMVAGGLTGVLIAGLLSGSAGCALGSLVGRVLDANFLDNRTCLGCGLTFRESSDVGSLNVQFTATAAAPASPAAPPAHFDSGQDYPG